MSKLIILGLFIVSMAYSYAEQKSFKPDPKIAEIIRQAVAECSQNPDISELVDMVKKGAYKSDLSYQKLVYCAFLKSGFSRDDGTIYVDKVLQLFKGIEDKVSDVIHKCDKKVKDDFAGTTFSFYSCFQDNSNFVLDLTV